MSVLFSLRRVWNEIVFDRLLVMNDLPIKKSLSVPILMKSSTNAGGCGPAGAFQAWGSGRLGAQARVGQTGCFWDEDKEGQEVWSLDCAFGQLLSAVAKKLLAVAENPEHSGSERGREAIRTYASVRSGLLCCFHP